MRIALIIENFNIKAGGNERSTAQIAAGLAQRGHDVTILTGSCGDGDLLPGVRIIAKHKRKSASFIRMVQFAIWARRKIQKEHFDITWSVTPVVPATVFQPHGGTVRETQDRNIALCANKIRKTLKKLEIKFTAKKQGLLFLEKRLPKDPRVKKFVAISSYVSDQFHRHYEIEDNRITLIPNGAQIPVVTDRQKIEFKRQVREKFSVSDGATTFLFPANNPRLKGLSTLLGALQKLVEKNCPAIVFMAGSNSRALHLAVKKAGLLDQVRFVGFIDNMEQMYAGCDVTVLPTFYDQSSLVVIESLMTGTPAITTSFNGAKDFIIAPGAQPRGIVIDDPTDDAALGQAMEDLTDYEFRQRCSQATEGLQEKLDIKHHIDALENLLFSLTESHND